MNEQNSIIRKWIKEATHDKTGKACFGYDQEYGEWKFWAVKKLESD